MPKIIKVPSIFCGSVVIEIAENIKNQLKGRRKNISLDLADVERIDTLALQLLVSIQSSCNSKGGKLALENITKPVVDTISLMGLSVLVDGCDN